MGRHVVALALIVAFCAFVGFKEPRFFQPISIESVMLWMPLIIVAAVGQMLVIVTGGIDVSIGSILGFSGLAVGVVLKSSPALPLPLLFLAGIAFGLVLGVANASLVTWAKVSPLIVTIGSLAAFRGLAFMVSGGDQVDSTVFPDGLTALAKEGISLGEVTVNWLLVLALAVAGVFAFVARYTVFGRNVFAFGSNPAAAHLRGVSGNKVLFSIYALSGALAGLAGVMYAARFGFVNPVSAGQNFELTVIAAVVIGGTKLTGGVGPVLGVLLGCLLLSCINVGLAVLGIDANWQLLSYGVVILAAVAIDGMTQRRRK
jgi:rhamnose transport system permease protein